MRLRLIVVQCQQISCKVIYGCKLETQVGLIDTTCEKCEHLDNCGIKKNVEMFDVSHGMCHNCFIEKIQEVSREQEEENGNNTSGMS